MSQTLLTIDSRNLMTVGTTIQPQLAGATSFLHAKFPNHLSAHGHAFTTAALLYPLTNSLTLVNYTEVLELILELVRLTRFSRHPSRLVSMFACDRVSALQQFSLEYNKHGKVHEITGQSSGPYDMRYMRLGYTIAETWENAENYWSGHQTQQPLLEYVVPLPVKVGKQVGYV
jgi:hypothetical protein